MYCCGWTKQERFCHRAPLKRRMTNGERLSILIQISLFERLVCCLSGRRGVNGRATTCMDHEEMLSKKDCWKLHNNDSKHGTFFAKVPCFCLKIALLFVKEKTSAHFALFYCFSSFSSRARASAVFRFLPSPLHLCCVSA